MLRLPASLALCLALAFAPFSPAQHSHSSQSPAHGSNHNAGHSHGRQHMDKRFTDPEALAKSFDNPERAAWQMPDRVIADLELQPGQRVADIGAGTGYFSVRLARAAAKPTVYAVDIEDTMLAYLAKRAGEEGLGKVKTILAAPDNPKLQEPVDMVLVVNTYHHIADRLAYFRKVRAGIRPGGKLAIVDWKKGAPMGPADEYRFTPEEIRNELAAAGFRFVRQHDYLPNQNYLIFRAE